MLARVWGTDPARLRELTKQEYDAMVELLAAEAERMAAGEPPMCACGSPAVPGVDHGPASCRPAARPELEGAE